MRPRGSAVGSTTRRGAQPTPSGRAAESAGARVSPRNGLRPDSQDGTDGEAHRDVLDEPTVPRTNGAPASAPGGTWTTRTAAVARTAAPIGRPVATAYAMRGRRRRTAPGRRPHRTGASSAPLKAGGPRVGVHGRHVSQLSAPAGPAAGRVGAASIRRRRPRVAARTASDREPLAARVRRRVRGHAKHAMATGSPTSGAPDGGRRPASTHRATSRPGSHRTRTG